MKLGDNGEAFFVQETEQQNVSYAVKVNYNFVYNTAARQQGEPLSHSYPITPNLFKIPFLHVALSKDSSVYFVF